MLDIPLADKIPQILEKHGDERVDDYYCINTEDSIFIIRTYT